MMKKHFYNTLLLILTAMPAGVWASSFKPFADMLAWKAAETNSSWATTINFTSNTKSVTQSSPTFNTRAGVKAGFSYIPDDNDIETKVYWTYFPTGTSNNIPNNLQIVSSLFFSGSFFITHDLFLGGYASWDLVMNMLDAELSHTFHPLPALTLSPKLGVKGGSINQDINIRWRSLFFIATEDLSNHFTGIGPTFGLGAKWNVYQQFSLIGDVSTALMYGRWNESDIYKRPAAFLTTPTTISMSSNNSKLGTLMMDYFLGMEWLHQGRSNVAMKLGYEMQYWPSQLRLLAVQQLPTLGDLTIQGGVCGITIDF